MSRLALLFRFGIGFVIFALLAGLTGWITLLVMTSGGDVYVPDIVGFSLQHAISSLQGSRLYIVLDGEEFHPEAPRNSVIAQNPPAGTSRKAYSTVRVILSAGPSRLEMPDLRGYGVRQARLVAGELVDGVFTEHYIHHSDYAEGEVVAHIPGPGEVIVPKSSISLIISSGPEKLRYRMPDLIGRTLAETRGILQVFLSHMDVTISDRRDFGPGIVMDQVPKPGNPLEPGDGIHLTVTPQNSGLSGPSRFVWTVPEGRRNQSLIATYTVKDRTEILTEREVQPEETINLLVPVTGMGLLEIFLDGSVVFSEVR